MSAQKGTASTRLLSMKFMQRAAATDSPKSTPSTPDGRPAKRMRLSNGTSTPATPVRSDQQRVQAAQTEEELQRSAVMERLAAEAGETRWVLNVREPAARSAPLDIVHASFADLDPPADDNAEDDEGTESKPMARLVAGRMVFGKIQKPQVAPQASQGLSESGSESDSESDSDTESSEDSDGDPVEKLVRDAARGNREAAKAKKQAQKQEQQRLAALRRKKEINLNSSRSTAAKQEKEIDLWKLKSISGGMASHKPKTKGSSYRSPSSRK